MGPPRDTTLDARRRQLDAYRAMSVDAALARILLGATVAAAMMARDPGSRR